MSNDQIFIMKLTEAINNLFLGSQAHPNIAHRSFLSIKYNFSSALANSRKKCRFLDCNVDTEVSEILACFCLSQVTVSVTSLLDEFNESTHTCQ